MDVLKYSDTWHVYYVYPAAKLTEKPQDNCLTLRHK